MDTSKEYVKMCEKAVEIQEAWKPKCGDWFMCECTFWCIGNAFQPSTLPGGEPIPVEITGKEYGWGCIEDKIWLPRQDQLQEMLSEIQKEKPIIRDNPIWLAGALIEWVACDPAYANKGASMEQLWLAFVMKEKYDKIWDGEDWINV